MGFVQDKEKYKQNKMNENKIPSKLEKMSDGMILHHQYEVEIPTVAGSPAREAFQTLLRILHGFSLV